MTTPAERLRRALPPKPKGGYELGTRDADTAAVLDQLDARGTGLTPEETAARDALVMALAALPIDMGGNLRVVLSAFARLDAEVAAARLTLTEREADYQAALAENTALRASLDNLTKVYAVRWWARLLLAWKERGMRCPVGGYHDFVFDADYFDPLGWQKCAKCAKCGETL